VGIFVYMNLCVDRDLNCGKSWLHEAVVDRDMNCGKSWLHETVCRQRHELWGYLVT